MRTSNSVATGLTLASLFYGRELRDPFEVDVERKAENESGDRFMDRMRRMVEIVRENLKKAADERDARYDKACAEHASKVGDRVLRGNNVLRDASLGFTSGLAHGYEGLFVISKREVKNIFD
jgi:hypothetical protein